MRSKILKILSLLLCYSYATRQPVDQTIIISKAYKVPGNNSFVFCDDPKDYTLEIDHLDVKPNPPKAGDHVEIKGPATLHQEMKKGSTFVLDVKLKAGAKIPVYTNRMDICEASIESIPSCPIKEGDVDVDIEVDIPDDIKGNYIVTGTMYDEGENVVVCVRTTVKL